MIGRYPVGLDDERASRALDSFETPRVRPRYTWADVGWDTVVAAFLLGVALGIILARGGG